MSNTLKKILVAAAFVGVSGAASATCTSGCTTTPTTPTAGSQTTTVGNTNTLNGGNSAATAGATIKDSGNSTATAAQQTTVGVVVDTKGTVGDVKATGGSATSNVVVDTKGTVGNVTGGSVATGAVQNSNVYSNTTTYKAAVSTAIGATATTPNADGCKMSTRGFGLGAQAFTWGVSGNVSGKTEWNEDSAKCDSAQAENIIISKGGNPVDSTAALLTAAQKSERVQAAANALVGAEGAALMSLFAKAQAPVVVAAPANATPNVTIVAAPAAAPATNLICKKGERAVQDIKTGAVIACVPQ